MAATIRSSTLSLTLDLIDLSAFNITFADLVFTGDVITIDGVDDFSIDLNGVAAASLSADDFILAASLSADDFIF